MDSIYCKCEIKKELLTYYDTIKSEIDIKAQLIMIEIECPNRINTNNVSVCMNQLMSTNLKLVNLVNEIMDKNMNQINEFYYTNSAFLDVNKIKTKDDLKRKSLKNYCVFIHNEKLRDNLREKHKLGLVVLLDWYLSESEAEFLRNQFCEETKEMRIQLNKVKNIFQFCNFRIKLIILHKENDN
jgi:hypothetical protein